MADLSGATGFHNRPDGVECFYLPLGNPPVVCTKCGWTPLVQERDDLRNLAQRLYEALRDDHDGWPNPDPNCEVCDLLAGAKALSTAERTVTGHKVFVFERDGSPWIEMVNDDRPLVRMTLQLLPDDAREIARWLNDAADATQEADRG